MMQRPQEAPPAPVVPPELSVSRDARRCHDVKELSSATTSPDNEPRRLDSSVSKALALLDALATAGSGVGVTELGRKVGVPKSTAFRLLSLLTEAGLVERRGTLYYLGRRLFELGSLVAEVKPRSLRDISLAYLEDLYEITHETVHLGVLDGTDVLYLEKIHGHHPAQSPSRVGGRVPAHCAALGKAMLAFSPEQTVRSVIAQGFRPSTPYTIVLEDLFLKTLAEIRTAGVAFDREEARLGLTCVAAPILDARGVAAAVSVSGSTLRFDPARFVEPVRHAALSISKEIADACFIGRM